MFYNLKKCQISAQGAIEIVQLMFKMQPQEKRVSLACTDIQKMTPLHCASMFNHPPLVSHKTTSSKFLKTLKIPN